MVNTVRNYDDSYSYGSVEHKQKSKQLNKYYKLMGSVLIGLSFFVPYFLSDQDGNGAITAIMWVVSVVLFMSIKHK